MLVCTADRPPELQGVGAPQTIDQRNLYGAATRCFENPGVPDDADAGSWRALARRMVQSCVGPHAGPVHLNLAFREPLVGEAGPLPGRDDTEDSAGLTFRAQLDEAVAADPADLRWVSESCAEQRGVIVAGRGVDDAAGVVALAERLGWPLIADPRSGCRHSNVRSEAVVAHTDAILRHAIADSLRPDVVLRFGEPPSSKVVNGWLASSGARHIVVSPSRAVHDPDRVVERQILAGVASFASRIEADPAPVEWSERWRRVNAAASSALDAAFAASDALTEPLVARIVASQLPAGSRLMVSSSMPIRDLEWFASDVVPAVYANRGANGIDGVTSTAVGVALATEGTVGLLTGDIAFLHDINALLGLVRRSVDLRVVVVDNDGGGIFSFLPQAASTDRVTFEQLWGTPHGADITALAAAHGLATRECVTVAELKGALAVRGPVVIRVPTNRDENVTAHDVLNRAVATVLDELAS
jgi:2-succinyl-5-enolpyruvyl-6-hydroxy-3-cyclohexene-1-carboxylate synthase